MSLRRGHLISLLLMVALGAFAAGFAPPMSAQAPLRPRYLLGEREAMALAKAPTPSWADAATRTVIACGGALGTPVRRRPDAESPVVAYLPAGTFVDVRGARVQAESQGDFYQLADVPGWVHVVYTAPSSRYAEDQPVPCWTWFDSFGPGGQQGRGSSGP